MRAKAYNAVHIVLRPYNDATPNSTAAGECDAAGDCAMGADVMVEGQATAIPDDGPVVTYQIIIGGWNNTKSSIDECVGEQVTFTFFCFPAKM